MAIKVITDINCGNYCAVGHPERPVRILKTVEKFKNQSELEIISENAQPIDEALLLKAHTKELIDSIKNADTDFDNDTPAYPDIYKYASVAAGGAFAAAMSALNGEGAFSLLRPPGHHSTKDKAMGFCYFNNIAIAAKFIAEDKGTRIAIYDFDVHHGNGTEDILLNQPLTAFYSVHEFPHYPGTGTSHIGNNCFNYPMPPNSPRVDYLKRLEEALNDLKKFNPSIVGVSAGFDAFIKDPLATQLLEVEDFYWLGRQFKKLDLPIFCVLEGGYSYELPDLIMAFLKGINENN